MSLSKEEKHRYMIVAGAAALLGAAAGLYSYMYSNKDTVYLEEPAAQNPLRRTITNKTKFDEKGTSCLSHDAPVSQDAIDNMTDAELLAKVKANTKMRHK